MRICNGTGHHQTCSRRVNDPRDDGGEILAFHSRFSQGLVWSGDGGHDESSRCVAGARDDGGDCGANDHTFYMISRGVASVTTVAADRGD